MQSSEEDGGVSFSEIGGLNEQIRELREVIELPLTNPELFIRVGIKVRALPVHSRTRIPWICVTRQPSNDGRIACRYLVIMPTLISFSLFCNSFTNTLQIL
jgi:hypothetical protein